MPANRGAARDSWVDRAKFDKPKWRAAEKSWTFDVERVPAKVGATDLSSSTRKGVSLSTFGAC